MNPEIESLLHANALAAQRHSHAPYSGFAVGAALVDEEGKIYKGCNVENAAYPQSLCAEAVALGTLIVSGGRRIKAVLILGPIGKVITPCGGCRQKLREFAGDDLAVLCADETGVRERYTLGALLPASFGPGRDD